MDPVIEIFFIISDFISSSDILAGSPDNKFTTPGGTPASLQISTISITLPGVMTSGFTITEQPAANAVEIFLDASTTGKFQGTKAATTPIGWYITCIRVLGKRLWFISPNILLVSSEFHSNISAAPPTSPGPSVKGFPTSNVSHFDKTSTLCLINSEIFLIIFALSQGEVFLQIFKPFSADLRALWTSELLALDALPIISSVAGLMTS